MSSIVSRLGLSMLTTTTSGSSSRTRADQILRALQPRQQAIARSRQARFHDLGAGGIVVDQQDGQWLGHRWRLAAALGRNIRATLIKALFLTGFPSSQRPDCDLAVGTVTWP